MIKMKKYLFIVNLVSMILFCFFITTGFQGNAFTQKPRYLKSVTYFGDEWAINFWSSESHNMDQEMEKIHTDGFNSIILIIPWREFQPDTNSCTYSDYTFDKLHQVMDAAQRHGLWVSLRLGYTWDYYSGENVTDRYEKLMWDRRTQEAWLNYAKTIYEAAASHPNLYGGFITWEDFWNFTYKVPNIAGQYERVQTASMCGFTEFVENNYTLEELRELYQEDIIRYSDVYMPKRSQPAMRIFYEFYDDFLNRLLEDTQQVFPGLSMEVRLDGEYIYNIEGTHYYYQHYNTYGCGGAPYTAAMYGIPIGQINNYEMLDANTAMTGTVRALDSVLAHSGGKKIYLDQYLYMDNTPEYNFNARIEEGQLPIYLNGMIPILKPRIMGYGIWVYQDYKNNLLYNPQFALGTRGWSFDEGSHVIERDGSQMACIPSGGQIRQKLNGRLNGSWEEIFVSFTADSENSCNLNVFLGNEMKTVKVDGREEYCLTFDRTGDINLAIQSSGQAYVDNVNVYTYIQDGQLYDTDGNELSCIGAVRAMNQALN